MLAGWFGPAVLVVIISGLDRDCGNALGAFSTGPFGCLVGFPARAGLLNKI
jgi:hypothetical protein